MARIKEEAVTERIGRVFGIKVNELRVEQIDEIGTAHSTTRVTRLSLLYHCSCQDTNIVGSLVQFIVSKHIF